MRRELQSLCAKARRDDLECAPLRFAHHQRKEYYKFRVWSDRVCGAQRSNESPSGAFKRQRGLRQQMEGPRPDKRYPNKITSEMQTHCRSEVPVEHNIFKN